MKKILFAISAVALLFATSCKKENVNPPVDDPEGSFTATIDNMATPQNAPRVTDGMGTMTTIDGNNNVIWEDNDSIKINGNTYITAKGQATSVFSPKEQSKQATGPDYHAFYPAEIAGTGAAGVLPAIQTIAAGNVSNLPMYAHSTDNQLTFHHICAALKVNVSIACDSIVVSADENICGEFAVDATTYTAQLAETGDYLGKSVRAVKSEGYFTADEIAYIAIPAGTYTNFTMKFYADGSIADQKSIASLTVVANTAYSPNIPAGLCFTAVDATDISMAKYSSAPESVELEYCIFTNSDKQYTSWATFMSYGHSAETVTLAAGDKIYFRAGANGNKVISGSGYHYFTSTGNVTISGNIMYLLNQNLSTTLSNDNNAGAFNNLFNGMTTLIDASDLILPATTLSGACYQAMFSGCTNLTGAPVLPAATLVSECYSYMFYDCKNLTALTMLATNTDAAVSGSALQNWLNGTAWHDMGTLTLPAGYTEKDEVIINVMNNVPASWYVYSGTEYIDRGWQD